MFCRKCGWGDAVDDGDGGRVGTRRGVRGWFAANAAWGMLSMTGMADASARGGACGAVFPQMRSEDAAEGGGRWTRRHAERRAGLVCRKCGPGEDAGRGCRRGCRERMPERMPGEDTDRMPGGVRKQGAGSGKPEAGNRSRERSREQEQGTGAGNRSGGKGAVSGFLRRCRDFLLF